MSATTCRRCGAECCESCLVFSFGEAKAPFCPPCALAVAGLDAVDECAADSRATASASTTA